MPRSPQCAVIPRRRERKMPAACFEGSEFLQIAANFRKQD